VTDEMPARDSAGHSGPVDSGLSWRPPPGSETTIGGSQRTRSTCTLPGRKCQWGIPSVDV